MSSCFVVVASLKDGMADGVITGDVDSAFVGEDSGFMLPIGEAGAEGEGNGTIHGLEDLENERIVSRGGLNTIREGGVDDADKKRWRE